MIKAEIIKGDRTYKIDFDEKAAVEFCGEASIDAVYNHIQDVARSIENYSDGTQILDLGTSQEYDHIRVWVEADPMQQIVEEVQAETDEGYIKTFQDKITYLGQSLEIYGVKALDDGVPFVMIWWVNADKEGGPSTEMLKKKNLTDITYYQGEALGYNAPHVIVPHASIYAKEEALDYVKDYIETLKKDRDDTMRNLMKNAKAFSGWNKEDE